MKDHTQIVDYAWATRYVIRRDSTATITIDITNDATPGQLAALVARITQEKGWTR